MNASGGASAVISTQSLSPGNYTATCLDSASGKSASVSLTVTGIVSIYFSRGSVPQGTADTLNYSGLTPNTNYYIYGNNTYWGAFTASSTGGGSVSINTSGLSVGSYNVVVYNATQSVATTTLTILAPAQKQYLTKSGAGSYTSATMTYPNQDAAGASDQIVVAVKNNYSSEMYVGVVIYVSGTEVYDNYGQAQAGETLYYTGQFTMPSGVAEADITAIVSYYGASAWVEDITLTAGINKV
jgi:hypothetical protein